MDPGSMSRDINASFLLITNSFLLFLVTLHLIIKARHIIVENVKYKGVDRKEAKEAKILYKSTSGGRPY